MPFVPTPNVAEVVLSATQDGQELRNVFHFRSSLDIDGPILEDLLDMVATWVADHWADHVSNNVHAYRLAGRSLETISSAVRELAIDVTGARTAQALPNNVTVALKLVTGYAGRSFRGRIFHMGLGEDMVDLNTVTSGIISALIADYTPLLTLSGLATWTLVVLSKFTGGSPRSTGVATDVQSISVDPTTDSQRRRLPGRGA